MDLLKYFGKLIPIGEKVTITGYQFNYMMTLGIAACVIFLGHWMVRHSKFLQKYCIPAPVVAGLVVSIILAIAIGTPWEKIEGTINSGLANTLKSIAMVIVLGCIMGSSPHDILPRIQACLWIEQTGINTCEHVWGERRWGPGAHRASP